MIRTHTQQRWLTRLKGLTATNHSLWRTAKKMISTKISIPPINVLHGFAKTAEETVIAITDSFELQFSPHIDPNISQFYTGTLYEFQQTNQNELNLQTENDLESIHLTKVLQIIESFKLKKSAGLDKISNKIIKNLPITYICWLTVLLNHMLNFCF